MPAETTITIDFQTPALYNRAITAHAEGWNATMPMSREDFAKSPIKNYEGHAAQGAAHSQAGQDFGGATAT